MALPIFATRRADLGGLRAAGAADDPAHRRAGVPGLRAVGRGRRSSCCSIVVVSATASSSRPTRRAAATTRSPRRTSARGPGVVVASALLVDYVLTVAVSVASGVDNIISALPGLNPCRVELAVGFVILIVDREPARRARVVARLFAIPTYLFIGSRRGHGRRRPRPHRARRPAGRLERRVRRAGARSLTQAALILLLLRAFSSGCSALTGVEAISNGVPAFRRPKVRNAQTTLVLMGGSRSCCSRGSPSLALISRSALRRGPVQPDRASTARTSRSRASWRRSPRRPSASARSRSTSSRRRRRCVLLLAANTAFNGFPLLGSVLARDGYAPKALNTRGDRLVYSNGMIILGHRRDRHPRDLPGEPHHAHPAVHHRRVRLVHARPDRHGAALAPCRCAS